MRDPIPYVVSESGDTDSAPQGAVPIALFGSASPALKNFTGQVRVNYTGLSLTNFTAATNKEFDIASATANLSPPPTTIWPYGNGTSYNPDFYDPAINRLREHNKPGQQHEWRLIGTFANKVAANNGALIIEMFNPDSGFIVNESVTMPSTTTAGNWSVDLITIADGASLDPGRGYRLRARTSFSDANFQCVISNILRVSRATENELIS